MSIQSLLSVIVLVYTITSTESKTNVHKLYIDNNDCTYDIYHVSETKTYQLLWNSEKIPSYCKFGFIGRGDDILDQYKVCVKPTEYDVKDCNINLNYYFGYSLSPNSTYGCNDNPPEICAPKDQYFDVELEEKTRRPSTYTYTGSKLKLNVRAEKVTDNSDRIALIGGIVGGVIGGIILLAIIAVVVCICICNRQTRSQGRGHVYNTGQTNMGMTSVTVSNTTQSVTTPQPAQAYPASAYPRQNYPTQQYGPVQPVAQQTAVPPPYTAGPNDLQEKL